MPIVVKDHKFRQTENFVAIHVPLHGVHTSKVDLLTAENYLKASFAPFFFEAFLPRPIDVAKSKCTLNPTEILFELCKRDKIIWDEFELRISKEEKCVIRREAFAEVQERVRREREEKKARKDELRKCAVSEAIGLDTRQRSLIEEIKAAEKAFALGDLKSWNEGLKRGGGYKKRGGGYKKSSGIKAGSVYGESLEITEIGDDDDEGNGLEEGSRIRVDKTMSFQEGDLGITQITNIDGTSLQKNDSKIVEMAKIDEMRIIEMTKVDETNLKRKDSKNVDVGEANEQRRESRNVEMAKVDGTNLQQRDSKITEMTKIDETRIIELSKVDETNSQGRDSGITDINRFDETNLQRRDSKIVEVNKIEETNLQGMDSGIIGKKNFDVFEENLHSRKIREEDPIILQQKTVDEKNFHGGKQTTKKKNIHGNNIRTQKKIQPHKKLAKTKPTINTDISIPLPRTRATIEVDFTERALPTPSRESKKAEEDEWLAKQAEARRSAGFVSEDLRPEEKNPQFLLAKGDKFLKSGNLLGAISAYSFGIKISPKFVDLYIRRSQAQFMLGNYNNTAKDCSSALELMKPEVSANLEQRALCIGRRGLALYKLGLKRQALDELKASLCLNSGNAEFGKCYYKVLDELNSGKCDEEEEEKENEGNDEPGFELFK